MHFKYYSPLNTVFTIFLYFRSRIKIKIFFKSSIMHIQQIESKIHEIRGQKVMLDYDLAELYETETKYLKRSVRTNLNRFPPDFMFELSKTEWETLRCNFSTSNQRGGTRY